MTQFWRDGFYRRSIYGVQHWVEGHWVDRDDWDRDSNARAKPDYWESLLRAADADGSATARFYAPNAKCPVCGASVFFYQNQQGSRVFFDDLGPPWPKHPCTDNLKYLKSIGKPESVESFLPLPRTLEEIGELQSYDTYAGIDREFDFGHKYGSGRWYSYRIDRRLKAAIGSALILSNIAGDLPVRIFVCSPRLPRALVQGESVFVHRKSLSYFDRIAMESVTIEIERIGTASALVEYLVGNIRG